MRALLTAVLVAWAGSQVPAPAPVPVPSDLTEKVEVRFVILDALVIDPKGRIVDDLTADDFELFLDLRPHPVATVDVDCPVGASADPRPQQHGEQREALLAQGESRRIALVIDYRHLPQTLRVEVVERLEAMVRDNTAPGEELMVAAVTRRLRVEQPFTSDRDEVMRALRRMKTDRTLWEEYPVETYSEFELFRALEHLIRLLGTVEGSKALVFFSDLPTKIPDVPYAYLLDTPPAFDYDRQFEALGTAATEARVAIYPIHSSGLQLRRGSHRLARLAVETGGRFSENTNDLSLAYARAQRDLGCRYAVGFYHEGQEPDRQHRVNLRARRKGLQVRHPVFYRFDAEENARAALDAATYRPPMFAERAVGVRLFQLRPSSNSSWEAAVAVSFPVSVPDEEAHEVRYDVTIDQSDRRTHHRLDSSLTVGPDPDATGLQVVVVEKIDLAPGPYDVSIAVHEPGSADAVRGGARIVLPRLPRRGLVVPIPMLAREPPDDIIVRWGAELTGQGMTPLVDENPVATGTLAAFGRVCWMGKPRGGVAVRVERSILRDGADVRRLVPIEMELSGPGDVTCRATADELSLEALEPGNYVFEVAAFGAGSPQPVRGRAEFTVAP